MKLLPENFNYNCLLLNFVNNSIYIVMYTTEQIQSFYKISRGEGLNIFPEDWVEPKCLYFAWFQLNEPSLFFHLKKFLEDRGDVIPPLDENYISLPFQELFFEQLKTIDSLYVRGLDIIYGTDTVSYEPEHRIYYSIQDFSKYKWNVHQIILFFSFLEELDAGLLLDKSSIINFYRDSRGVILRLRDVGYIICKYDMFINTYIKNYRFLTEEEKLNKSTSFHRLCEEMGPYLGNAEL
uniref:Uncharacterized protein n=1 Tax=Caulerpa lentillifera TaxID=148947 RepID=A0A345HGZ9_9CHLO|nr:hypothetical protein [Caulerpa lentillifera]AXG75889.1 hypothetical protein [Caulerpa lentillifera]QKS32285.1 hypothetical protein [Caulerpa lentillifera]QUV75656.1 hypothetical protein [Caulerpa lentillifera]